MNRKKRSPLPLDDRGLVLVVGLILISVLLIIGATAVLTTTTDLRISGNQRNASQAFNIAEAGSEAARENLRLALAGGASFSSLLNDRRGPNNALSNSDDFLRRAFVSDDIPFVSSTSFGTGTYRVFLSNDPVEGVSATDNNSIVTLTSIATGPGDASAVVQVIVRRLIAPGSVPGAIVLPGPGVTFHGGTSSAQVIQGGTQVAVAVTVSNDPNDALKTVIDNISKPETYRGNCATLPCVAEINMPHPWNDLDAIRDLVAALRDQAHTVTGNDPKKVDWGTEKAPRIVFVDGDVRIGPVDGAGIIIATGSMEIHGDFNYTGLILALGKGSISRYGGGNGMIRGGVLAANIAGPDGILNTGDDRWGNPFYDARGGGTSDITFSGAATDENTRNLSLTKTSWRRSGF